MQLFFLQAKHIGHNSRDIAMMEKLKHHARFLILQMVMHGARHYSVHASGASLPAPHCAPSLL